MTLTELESRGEIVPVRASQEEIGNLWKTAQNKLKDAQLKDLTYESRLDLAYHAIFVLAKLALRCHGYKLKGERNEHVRTLETLQHTVQAELALVAFFQKLRVKRHKDLYEGGISVSETEVKEATRRAKELNGKVRKLVEKSYPSLFHA